MDSRPLGRAARASLIVFLLAGLAAFGGCNLLAGLGYITHNDNTSAEFDKLSGKRVAIVCRPVEQLQYSDSTAAPDLATADETREEMSGDPRQRSRRVGRWS